ncbi:MAG: HD domain-containing protein, partial [Spirochaetales bacterium]|nr:HD domain-containing protein [Spirochaetales bacterium]
AKTVRAIGVPEERFREDGLRLLRACRFACQLAFSIDERTLDGMIACRANIAHVSAERIRDEVNKILLSPIPSAGFLTMERVQLLDMVLPELSACRGVEQYGNHLFDVLNHSLFSCDGAPAVLEIRLAALFHDVGKPACRRELPNGTVVFHEHEKLSAQLAETALRRLKYPRATETTVTHLISNHMFAYSPEWTDAAVRRFVRRVGKPHLESLFALRIADGYGMRRTPVPGREIDDLQRRINSILRKEDAITVRDLAVNGNDLAGAGIPKGPQMGLVLDFLLETVLDDPAQNERHALIGLAMNFFNKYLTGKQDQSSR